MAKNNFILMSLEDEQTKKIANIVSNDSCKKILDYLSEHEDATESSLAEHLKIPLPTVHYNIQQLMEAGLVVSKEFNYSKKGRTVNYYQIANKYIIITPKKVHGIREKLSSILPTALITLVAGGIIYFVNNQPFSLTSASKDVATEAVSQVATNAAPMVMSRGAEIATSAVPVATSNVPNIAMWFGIGAIFAIVVSIIISYIKDWRQK